MSIILTCALTAGFLFTAPEGYTIERLAGPPKVEKTAPCENCLYFSEGSVLRGDREPDKITIRMRQVGKASDTFDLPVGCTGEAKGVSFKAK
jgi:hypothetical protein